INIKDARKRGFYRKELQQKTKILSAEEILLNDTVTFFENTTWKTSGVVVTISLEMINNNEYKLVFEIPGGAKISDSDTFDGTAEGLIKSIVGKLRGQFQDLKSFSIKETNITHPANTFSIQSFFSQFSKFQQIMKTLKNSGGNSNEDSIITFWQLDEIEIKYDPGENKLTMYINKQDSLDISDIVKITLFGGKIFLVVPDEFYNNDQNFTKIKRGIKYDWQFFLLSFISETEFAKMGMLKEVENPEETPIKPLIQKLRDLILSFSVTQKQIEIENEKEFPDIYKADLKRSYKSNNGKIELGYFERTLVNKWHFSIKEEITVTELLDFLLSELPEEAQNSIFTNEQMEKILKLQFEAIYSNEDKLKFEDISDFFARSLWQTENFEKYGEIRIIINKLEGKQYKIFFECTDNSGKIIGAKNLFDLFNKTIQLLEARYGSLRIRQEDGVEYQWGQIAQNNPFYYFIRQKTFLDLLNSLEGNRSIEKDTINREVFEGVRIQYNFNNFLDNTLYLVLSQEVIGSGQMFDISDAKAIAIKDGKLIICMPDNWIENRKNNNFRLKYPFGLLSKTRIHFVNEQEFRKLGINKSEIKFDRWSSLNVRSSTSDGDGEQNQSGTVIMSPDTAKEIFAVVSTIKKDNNPTEKAA
ncbi:MAG: hypothetical protein ACD_79C01430G0003, partial [uncultured bacterium]